MTRYSIAGAKEKWPYDTHQEEMAVITDGGYAPFSALDAFAVFSRDLNALLMNTKLTIDLIRGSRRSGKSRPRQTKPSFSVRIHRSSGLHFQQSNPERIQRRKLESPGVVPF